MRGTPNRNQARGTVPAFTNSPASNIPRPALEHTATTQSEAGGSTMSASRQKQTKRDEVCWNLFQRRLMLISTGYPEENRNGSAQEEAYYQSSQANPKSSPWNRPCPASFPGSPNQTQYHRSRGGTIDGSKEGGLCAGYRRR